VWSRLSVFAEDFELAAAEVVCAGNGLEPGEVSDAVFGLVDKSVLVASDQGGRRRLRMLTTLREYGRERLREEHGDGLPDSPGEEEVAARHLDWYAGLARRFEREWFGPDQPEWLARVGAELPNIRAALELALARPEHVRTGQQVAADLCHFWNAVSRREGMSWLTRVVEAEREPSRELVHALSALSWVSSTAGAPDLSWRSCQEAESLVREHAPERLPRILHNMGMNLMARQDPRAVAVIEEAVRVAKEQLGERSEEAAYATFCLGFCVGVLGEGERSAQALADCVSICRGAGERWWLGWVRTAQAFAAWTSGDLDRHQQAATEALLLARQLSEDHLCATALSHLALAHVGRDDRRAAYLIGICESYWHDTGSFVLGFGPTATVLDQARRMLVESLGEAAFEEQLRRGGGDRLEAGVALVLAEAAVRTDPRQDTSPRFRLTPRESEIARLVAEGLSNRDVAARLVLSTRTVESHVQNIFTKTGFTSRVHLAMWYAGHAGGP
jgi:DNA-binding CsgD family transcriptional regulator